MGWIPLQIYAAETEIPQALWKMQPLSYKLISAAWVDSYSLKTSNNQRSWRWSSGIQRNLYTHCAEMLWCSFTAWAPHSILTKAKANTQDGEGRRAQNGRCVSCPCVCLKWQVWGTVLSPALQNSIPHPNPWTIFLPSVWATRCVTLASLHGSLYGQRCGSLAPVPALPSLGQLTEAGGYCWDPAPTWPPATQIMVGRPLRYQACPWPWSQAKLQGQPASLGFMLHPACGPITATLIMQASKSSKGIIQRKKKDVKIEFLAFLLSNLYVKYSQHWEGRPWKLEKSSAVNQAITLPLLLPQTPGLCPSPVCNWKPALGFKPTKKHHCEKCTVWVPNLCVGYTTISILFFPACRKGEQGGCVV